MKKIITKTIILSAEDADYYNQLLSDASYQSEGSSLIASFSAHFPNDKHVIIKIISDNTYIVTIFLYDNNDIVLSQTLTSNHITGVWQLSYDDTTYELSILRED